MKSAEEWLKKYSQNTYALVRDIQRDALEVAARECEKDVVRARIGGGADAVYAMKSLASAIRALMPDGPNSGEGECYWCKGSGLERVDALEGVVDINCPACSGSGKKK